MLAQASIADFASFEQVHTRQVAPSRKQLAPVTIGFLAVGIHLSKEGSSMRTGGVDTAQMKTEEGRYGKYGVRTCYVWELWRNPVILGLLVHSNLS